MAISTSRNSYFLAIASALVLAGAASPALAQDDGAQAGATDDDTGAGDAATGDAATGEGTEGDTPIESEDTEIIYVTGIRGSLQASTDKKRYAPGIVEAISAEEIGKLPDSSIAESIARAPGVTTQRLDGRANVISIRGLSPDFTTTMLNGREQVSANNNRAVEYDQYPSELISGVIIYKTPDASVTSQAVGGTVDMQTISPLRHGKRTLTANIRGEYNDLGALNSGTTAAGYRGSLSYIDQYRDNTVGLALGYARLASPTQEERWQTWGFPNVDDDNVVIGGAKPYVKSNQLVRDGLMAVVELKPKDEKFSTTLEGYYSRFDDTQILRGIEIPLYWSGASLQPGYTMDNGIITAGQFNNVEVVVRNDVVQRDADTLAFGWNTKYVPDSKTEYTLDVSYSRVDRIESNMETYSGTGRGSGNGATDDLGFEMRPDGSGITFTHNLNYSDPALIRLGGPLDWGGGLQGYPPDAQDGFINRPSTEDSLGAIKLSGKRRLASSLVDGLEYGVRVSRRQKSLNDEGLFLTLDAYPADLPVPDRFLQDPTSLDFIGMGPMLSYDAQALYDSGAYIETPESATSIGRSVNSWWVREDVANAYLMTNINAKLGNMLLLGNAGVQLVYTDQSSTGYLAQVQDVTLPSGEVRSQVARTKTTDGTGYLDYLPSLNLTLGLTETQKLRLGVARILARPRMDQMNASSSVNYDPTLDGSTDINNSPWSGGGGNPKLRPWMTWQFDLSYEAYFRKGGYAAVAGYFKQVSSFPFSTSVIRDFSDYIPLLGNQPLPVLTEGFVTAPENTGNGKIYGVEVSAAFPFDVLSPSLLGTGAMVSMSLADSSITEDIEVAPGEEGPEPIDLPGFSTTVINGTLYYERYGFQVRGSVRYRSAFLGEVSGLSLVREKRFVKAETLLDAQIGYDLSGVGLKGMSALLQAQNLSNQPFVSYQGNPNNPDDSRLIRDYQNYGRTILFGVSWREDFDKPAK